MYCYNCGKEIKDNAKFCKHCGARLDEIVDETKLEENTSMQEQHFKSKVPHHKRISEAKNLGAIGAIICLLSIIPYIGVITYIVGLVLIFVAIKKIADITGRKEIFQDYIKSFVCGIISNTILLVGLASIPSIIGSSLFGLSGIYGKIGIGIMTVIIVSLALLIISAYFQKECFRKITEETGVELFSQTGSIYFIGSILTIILIGLLVLFIGSIMEIIAFFSLPDELHD